MKKILKKKDVNERKYSNILLTLSKVEGPFPVVTSSTLSDALSMLF